MIYNIIAKGSPCLIEKITSMALVKLVKMNLVLAPSCSIEIQEVNTSPKFIFFITLTKKSRKTLS